MRSESINELAAALVKAQADFPTVAKDANNPFFKSKYADLATVVKTAGPVLAKYGLAVSQFVSHHEGQSTLITYLLQGESGQYIAHEMPLLLPKNDPQGQGSAITYARRYSYMSVLGLVADEDDDGNAASKAVSNDKPNQQPAPVRKERHPVADLDFQTKLNKLRLTMARNAITGEAATTFITEKIGVPQPTTEAEVDKLLLALEEPF